MTKDVMFTRIENLVTALAELALINQDSRKPVATEFLLARIKDLLDRLSEEDEDND